MTPEKAFWHAIKHGPSEKTRTIACENPYFAYQYAKEVDKCPHEDTRKGAYKSIYYAFEYAKNIDKCFRKDAWEIIKQDERYKKKYKKRFISQMKGAII